MPDRPDFSPQRAVDIVANSIGTIPIDIASESIGQLAVDISSTSVGTIGIDVEAQTIGELGIDIATQTLNVVDQETIATPSESISFIEINDSTDVSGNNGFAEVIIRPPTGQLFEVVAVEANVGPVTNATTGTHSFIFKSETEAIQVLRGSSVFSDGIDYNSGYWDQATDEKEPPDVQAQGFQPRGLRIDETNGLEIEYNNLTDATQTRTRQIRAWVREIRVAV